MSQSLTPTPLRWEARRYCQWTVHLQPPRPHPDDSAVPDTTDEIAAYVATGDPESGSEGVGFRIEERNGSQYLAGVIHDGDTERHVDLEQPTIEPGRLALAVEYDPGNQVTWYVADRSVGDITNDAFFPAGETAAESLWSATLENQVSGGDAFRQIDVDARIIQEAE